MKHKRVKEKKLPHYIQSLQMKKNKKGVEINEAVKSCSLVSQEKCRKSTMGIWQLSPERLHFVQQSYENPITTIKSADIIPNGAENGMFDHVKQFGGSLCTAVYQVCIKSLCPFFDLFST